MSLLYIFALNSERILMQVWLTSCLNVRENGYMRGLIPVSIKYYKKQNVHMLKPV